MTTRFARAFLCALLIFLALRTPATAGGPDPTSAYAERSVQGFTVLVNRRVLEHKNEAADALKEVNVQLERIARAVPPKPLAKLRKVRIWVEWANHPEKLTEFHPSAQWLRENGYNPEKAKTDFFPFTRADLKKYDPTGYRLMQEVWGQPSDGAAPSRKR